MSEAAEIKVFDKSIEALRTAVITREQILEAFNWYNQKYPNNDYKPTKHKTWWEDKRHEYAVIHEDKCYPPKFILYHVIRGDIRFPGGKQRTQANGIFETLGFRIVNKEEC